MLHISCNMCTRDLSDMYARSPRAEGIHIRQIPRAHATTYTCNTAVIYIDNFARSFFEANYIYSTMPYKSQLT